VIHHPITHWYDTTIVQGGRSGAFWLLISLLTTFLIVRGITRRIRARGPGDDPDEVEGGGVLRDVTVGGVHIHHQVWGIGLVLFSAFLEFRFQPGSPWVEVLGIMFGAGAALILDEFALALYMRDVYWTDEGRASVNAVLVALLAGGLMVLATSPLQLEDYNDGSRLFVSIGILVHTVSSSLAFLKSKWVSGALGLLLPVVGIVAAIRLAKPESVWARRFYSPRRMAAAVRREALTETRLNRLRNLLAGAPTRPPQ
jgi:hypothetical protein